MFRDHNNKALLYLQSLCPRGRGEQFSDFPILGVQSDRFLSAFAR
jgi:hypothetical protein